MTAPGTVRFPFDREALAWVGQWLVDGFEPRVTIIMTEEHEAAENERVRSRARAIGEQLMKQASRKRPVAGGKMAVTLSRPDAAWIAANLVRAPVLGHVG